MTEAAARTDGVRWSSLEGGDLTLHLNNTIDAVEQGRGPLAAFYGLHGLSPKVVNRIEVIFEELVSNVIRHGFEPASDQSIRVLATAEPDAIELLFEDDGAPFDPLAAAAPPKPESLQTAQLGGLGIPLVIGLSTSVRYESASDAKATPGFHPRNRLTIRVARA